MAIMADALRKAMGATGRLGGVKDGGLVGKVVSKLKNKKSGGEGWKTKNTSKAAPVRRKMKDQKMQKSAVMEAEQTRRKRKGYGLAGGMK